MEVSKTRTNPAPITGDINQLIFPLQRTDAGVAAALGEGDPSNTSYLLSDVAVLSSTNEDFQCWREVLEPAVFYPGVIWRCSLGKTV